MINKMKKQTEPKHRTQAVLPLDERYEALKQMLISRQRQLRDDLKGKIRSVRDEGVTTNTAPVTTLATHLMSSFRTIWNSRSFR